MLDWLLEKIADRTMNNRINSRVSFNTGNMISQKHKHTHIQLTVMEAENTQKFH